MVEWITVFIDVPEDRFDAALEFWTTVTGTTASAPRGDRGQFVTLQPAVGDAHLRMQKLGSRPRIHLDLHVHDVTEAWARATELGATKLADRGYVIMRSPAGMVFCLVTAGDESEVSPPLTDPAPHRVDHLCIDVPASRFGAECEFWSSLLGLELRRSPEYAEFAGLWTGPDLPWSLLIQRLGTDDKRTTAQAHLDISCGPNAVAVAERHVVHGAEPVGPVSDWVVLTDPAGLPYCTTSTEVRH